MMPNICINHIFLEGPAEAVAEFQIIMLVTKTQARLLSDDSNLVFDFDALIPCPPELLGTPNDRPWCVENWGTKWPAYNARIVRAFADEMYLRFTTAWQAPVPVFKAMATRFPQLAFRIISEPTEGWVDQVIYENGEEVDRSIAVDISSFFDEDDEDDVVAIAARAGDLA